MSLIRISYESIDEELFTGTWKTYQELLQRKNLLFFLYQRFIASKSSEMGVGLVRP